MNFHEQGSVDYTLDGRFLAFTGLNAEALRGLAGGRNPMRHDGYLCSPFGASRPQNQNPGESGDQGGKKDGDLGRREVAWV